MNSTAPSEPRKNSHRSGRAPSELRVDRERCIGAGMCVLTAAAVFDQDDADGRVVALTTAPTTDQEAAVREAAQMCPAGAITLLAH
ncbi:ferredoxin [Nocardia sp. NPDC058499]|uniref:ferredoxin n=1 Tax=Nocardia sp. NPDC058499 TaxID=3346530 RepID=UPI003658FA85